MPTIQIADKTTLDSVKTNTTNLLTKGGIKYNATSQKYQTYNTTNSSWVDTEFGGGGSPTMIVKNNYNLFDNKNVTVSNSVYGYSNTKSIGTNDTITFEVPYCGDYLVTCDGITKGVSVNDIGGIVVNLFTVPAFTDTSDAELELVLNLHYNDLIDIKDYWSVGDTRTIHLDAMQAPNPNSSNTWAAQDITVTIVDFDHTDLATPINGHTKAALTVQTREVLSGTSAGSAGTIYVNGDSSYDTTFTKWSNLYMRTYLNDKVWGAFPTNFKAMIKPSKHYRHTTYNGTASEEVTDNLFLPSYPEIFGTASYSYYAPTSPVEGTQFAYYQTSTNRVKYPNNNGVAGSSAQRWWEGSASSYYNSSYGYYWWTVDTDGSATSNNGNGAFGLAPAFAM